MADVFAKLNMKGRHDIVVLDPPEFFSGYLARLEDVTVHRDWYAGAEWALAFGTTLASVERFADGLTEHTDGDVIAWFSYPKASSKRYRCEFNRDTGWAALGAAGFEPVRQVAIDDDWSALRFRRVGFIAQMTRAKSDALTREGRRRTTGQDR